CCSSDNPVVPLTNGFLFFTAHATTSVISIGFEKSITRSISSGDKSLTDENFAPLLSSPPDQERLSSFLIKFSISRPIRPAEPVTNTRILFTQFLPVLRVQL